MVSQPSAGECCAKEGGLVMFIKSSFQQLELAVESRSHESRPLPAFAKKPRFQLSLFHPVGLPTEPTPSTDEHYIQVSAELKDRAAKENHPSRQVAADVRHATPYLRY